MDIYKHFICQHCKKPIILMRSSNGNIIPVNNPTKEKILYSERFDSKKYKSHLLDCPVLKIKENQDKLWHNKTKKIIERDPAMIVITITEPDLKLEINPENKKKEVRSLSPEEKAAHEKRFAEILAEELLMNKSG